MGGDYTRFTFDPVKDYSAVLNQQGRVGLDADWNELIEITDRRWRAETIDIIGRCVVPMISIVSNASPVPMSAEPGNKSTDGKG